MRDLYNEFVKKNKFEFTKFIAWVISVEAIGLLGAVFTVEAIPNWYAGLAKPWFNPPNWVFGPVWTTLYAMIGLAGYVIWDRIKDEKIKCLFVYQLILNAIWTPLFFGLKMMFVALVVILSLLVILMFLIGRLWRVNKYLGVLLIPYLLWVSFASVLNFALLILN